MWANLDETSVIKLELIINLIKGLGYWVNSGTSESLIE